MIPARSPGLLASLILATAIPLAVWSQPIPTKEAEPIRATSAARARSATAKFILPDPVLLDGAPHPAEKPSELGMIGEFELPGNENAQAERVGGPQMEVPAGAAGGKNQAMGLPAGMGGRRSQPQPAAGASALPSNPPPPGGGVGAQTLPGESGKSSGPAGGGSENSNAAGAPISGAADGNAQPQGVQVRELGGASGGLSDPGKGSAGGRPPPITIGDKSMRIETGALPAPIAGAQPVLNQNTQIYEKPTGTGGKAPTGTQGPNRAEKGRTMPASL